MINRTTVYIVGAMAAVAAIIAVVMLAAWGFQADAGDDAADDDGSLLNPRVHSTARVGYIIAELYQDVRLDIESGVYDEHGVLQGRHWTHDDVRQTCGVDLVVAVQRGIDQAAPTATLRPPATMIPYRPYPGGFAFAPPQAYPPYMPVQPVPPQYQDQARPSPTHTPWPAPTPYATPLPTFTPGPTPTPVPWPTATPKPLVSSVSWIGWENRPTAIEADGVVIMDVPRDADVSAQLSVWTGAHQTRQAMLAMLPLPDAQWEQGTARIRLQEGSGRILLSSDHVDAHHRSLRLRIQVAPLSDCDAPNLRWEKPAAVVIRALTEQPYADWQDRRLPPTAIPAPATLSGLTLSGMTISPGFDPATTTYTGSVPYATSETTVRSRLADPTETYVIRSGGIQLTENAPALAQLSPGANAITIEVSTADGNTTTTYTVTVSRETPSTDSSLASLALGGVSADQWTPPFDAGVYDYDVRVPHSTTRTTLLLTATYAAATVAVVTDPADALTDSGLGTTVVELAEGATTTVTITVTAEDGSTTQDYVVRVHRAGA